MKSSKNIFLKSLEALCSWHHVHGSKALVVQIGANDGRINDPIYEQMVTFRTATKILLIEPQDDVVDHLKKNYRFHPQATVWNGAIGSTPSLVLYRLKQRYYDVFTRRYLQDSPSYRVPTGFTSADHDHVLRHIAGNLPAEITPQEAIESVVKPCARLVDVLRAAEWEEKEIDILQIDTEGMDDEAIYASNLDVLQPVIINFEYRHIRGSRLQTLASVLKSLGYTLVTYNESDALAINTKRFKSHGFSLVVDKK